MNMPSASRPEVELLLTCARLELTGNQRDRIRQLLDGNLDWQYLLALAERHGLRPLLFRHLHAMGSGNLPRAVHIQLWTAHEQRMQHNRTMSIELVSILRLLHASGINALPYKGPVLAQCIYGDTALREFGDLDVLLRPSDILRAKQLLAASGYQPKYPLAPDVEAAFLASRANYHWMLLNHDRSILLELHWKTSAQFQVESVHDEQWWNGLPLTRFLDQDVRCFPPSELLLILCLHGSKHYWANLGWLVDVAELIRQQDSLDWPWIIDRADTLQASRRLAFGLYLLVSLLDVPLPSTVKDWLASQTKAAAIAKAGLDSLFVGEAPELDGWQRLRLNFALYETWGQRLRHAADVMLNPGLVEWSRWPLPRHLFFLYLPLRLFTLLRKYTAHRRPV